ncbi:MAG: S8 family peptidase [Candidatus Nanopelagicales bacterium]
MRRQLTRSVAVTAALCLVLPLVTSTAQAAGAEIAPPTSPPTATEAQSAPVTSLIVKYKPGVKPTEAPRVATGSGAVDDVDLEPGRKMSLGLRTVELSDPLTAAQASAVATELEQDPRVESATPDIKIFPADRAEVASATNPSDPYFQSADLWGLNGRFGIDAAAAWAATTGSGSVVVSVLDTGIRSHPDLASATQVAGYDMIENVAAANDGDGRDADPSDPGDWVSKPESEDVDSDLFECPVESSSWHGTHVTGTINATSDNGVGVSSVAPGVKVQPVRVLGKCGGTLSDILDGIAWASGGTIPDVPSNPTPAAIINMSLGGSGICDAMSQSVIDAAVVRGTTIVVAAGNSQEDAERSWPANCQSVVTVGASDSVGKRADFSNYGSSVDLSAPGAGIWSTSNTGTTTPASPTYARHDGTSMAAPHVAGLAALLKSLRPALRPAEVEARLKSTTSGFAGGKCGEWITCGTGIANSAAVISTTVAPNPPLAKAPGRVRTIKVTYKNLKAIIGWTSPLNNGHSRILGYHYRIAKGGGKWSAWSSTTSNKKVIHRKKRVKYVVQVAPVNSVGRGDAVKKRLRAW